MPKGNREKKKPKLEKPKPVAVVSPARRKAEETRRSHPAPRPSSNRSPSCGSALHSTAEW